MEEEKKLTEEANAPEVKKDDKLFKKPEGKSMYQKQREDTDDAETEAFARGELNKFNEEKAETATVQKDTETSEEIASSDGEATPSTERPENAEDRVFKKRYDDLKKHYDSTLFKHKDEVRTLRTQLETTTKDFVPPKPTSMGFLKVDAEAFPVTLKVYGDGVVIYHAVIAAAGSAFTVTGTTPSFSAVTIQEPVVRLPASMHKDFAIEVSSAKVVNEVCIAESIDELRGI